MTNEEVLHKLHKNRELLAIAKRKKLEYFGHMFWGAKSCLLQTIMKGKVKRKRRLGLRNLSWLRNIRKWARLNVEELFRIALDRERFKKLVGLVA